MEISWGVGLKEKTEKLVKDKLEAEENKKLTPWEEMIEKQKEKKKKRKYEKKVKEKREKNDDDSSSNNESDSDEESEDSSKDEDQPFSDDDIDVDMSDPFFQQEMRTNDVFKNAKGRKQKRDDESKDTKSKKKSVRRYKTRLYTVANEMHRVNLCLAYFHCRTHWNFSSWRKMTTKDILV